MIEILKRRDTWREVAHKLWRTTAVASAFGMALILFGGWIGPRMAALLPGPRLELVSLDVHDGKIWQLVHTVGQPIIRGTWSAAINADHDVICAGGGAAPYFDRKEPVSFSPSEWTGGDCSDLVPGRTYTARATWEFFDEAGLLHSISGETTFVWHPAGGGA